MTTRRSMIIRPETFPRCLGPLAPALAAALLFAPACRAQIAGACFGPPTFYAQLAGFIAAADMNGDGYADLVFNRFQQIFVMLNTGDGTGAFEPPIGGVRMGTVFTRLDVGDLDGDIDIATVSQLDQVITIILNDGAGNITLGRKIPMGPVPNLIDLADLDADGDTDMVVANQGDGTIAVLHNDGSGNFTMVQNFFNGPFTNQFSLGDLDNDGDPDLVASTPDPPTTNLYTNDGAGQFTLWQALPATAGDAQIVDFNGNGLPDIVAGDSTSSLGFRRQYAPGKFTQPHVVAFVDEVRRTGSSILGLEVADIDRDGQPDILTYGGFTQSDSPHIVRVRVIRGRAGGTISGWGDLRTFRIQSPDIDAADLAELLKQWGTDDPQADYNGDGVVNGADLAGLLSNFGPFPVPDDTTVIDAKTLTNPVLADFDNDGDLDVAVSGLDGNLEPFLAVILQISCNSSAGTRMPPKETTANMENER